MLCEDGFKLNTVIKTKDSLTCRIDYHGTKHYTDLQVWDHSLIWDRYGQTSDTLGWGERKIHNSQSSRHRQFKAPLFPGIGDSVTPDFMTNQGSIYFTPGRPPEPMLVDLQGARISWQNKINFWDGVQTPMLVDLQGAHISWQTQIDSWNGLQTPMLVD